MVTAWALVVFAPPMLPARSRLGEEKNHEENGKGPFGGSKLSAFISRGPDPFPL